MRDRGPVAGRVSPGRPPRRPSGERRPGGSNARPPLEKATARTRSGCGPCAPQPGTRPSEHCRPLGSASGCPRRRGPSSITVVRFSRPGTQSWIPLVRTRNPLAPIGGPSLPIMNGRVDGITLTGGAPRSTRAPGRLWANATNGGDGDARTASCGTGRFGWRPPFAQAPPQVLRVSSPPLWPRQPIARCRRASSGDLKAAGGSRTRLLLVMPNPISTRRALAHITQRAALITLMGTLGIL